MEQIKSICRNPWCKATFFYTEQDMTIEKNDDRNGKSDNPSDDVKKTPPNFCKKCNSFNDSLSGGVEWKDKQYEGSRIDFLPHEIKYKVTNFRL